VALFYYSGHALQYNGVNYLAPVDATLTDETDLRRMTRVDEIVSDLEQAKSLRIMVLDSCRDNPLADQLRRSAGATRSVPLGRGLAKIDAPQGMIMAYATQAGHTAADGDGRNSPYTTAFLKHIEEQNEIGTIFREISEDVYETTKRSQLPELSLSIIGRFYLRGTAPTVAASVSSEPSTAQSTSREFDTALGVNTASGWQAFLDQHPDGVYADLARERKAAIEKRTEGNQQAALPPDIDAQSKGAPDLPRALQAELRRIGCATGEVQDGWNANAQEAMERFNKRTGLHLDVKIASTEALNTLRSKTERVCPLLCKHGYRAEGDVCLPVTCGRGTHLSANNDCARDAPSADRIATPSPRHEATSNVAAPSAYSDAMRRADDAKEMGYYRKCMGALPGCYERAIKVMSLGKARAWCSRRPTC
jgi:hypothetical protein